MVLYFLDEDLTTIGIMDEFESLIWTDRYDERGDFELYIPASSEALYQVASASFVYLPESEHSMIIERIELKTDVEDGDKIIITGRSLEWLLHRRVIVGQKVYKGSLQDAIKSMINEAFIEPTDEDRKVSNLKFIESTDTAVTDLTTDIQVYYDNLYDVIANLCYANEIGFKLVINGDNFEFSLYSGVDRSFNQETNPYIIFSPDFDNLITSGYTSSEETYKNVMFVSGEGETVNKKVVAAGEGTGLNRREAYIDGGSISKTYRDDSGAEKTYTDSEYEDVLVYQGELELRDNSATEELEIEIEPNSAFVLGKDYFIGDIVQTKNSYGIEIAARIIEIIYNQDSEGLRIYPTVEIV